MHLRSYLVRLKKINIYLYASVLVKLVSDRKIESKYGDKTSEDIPSTLL
jgi:hypothetical protein